MKHIICSSLACLFSLMLLAQGKQKGINLESVTMDISLEAGIPIGNMKGSGIGPGAAFHLGYPVKGNIDVEGNVGYMRFTSKGKNGNGTNYMFYMLGIKYHISPPIHLDASLGYSIFKGTATHAFFPNGLPFNNKGITVGAGAGYRLADNLDASLRLQKGKTVFFIGLSLALRVSK